MASSESDRDSNSDSDDNLFHTPGVITRSRVYRVFVPGAVVPFNRTGTRWRIGPIQVEKVRTHEEEEFGDINDVSSVCVATQVEGPSPGMKAVMKIKIQLTPWEKDISELDYIPISEEAHREVYNLENLTNGGCSCTPKLIDFDVFRQSEKGGPVPGGYIVFILMEKVPGKNLENFDTFPLEKRDRVRIAFVKAIRFIVDLEDVFDDGFPFGFEPYRDFSEWTLNSRIPRCDHYEDDPMIPSLQESLNYRDDDESLYALAARSKEREQT